MDQESLVIDTERKFTRRRLLEATGGLTAMYVLAACGGDGEEAGPTKGKAEITFWVITPFTESRDAAIFDAADEYPGGTVKIESFPADSFKDRFITAVQGGGGPDVASVDSSWVAGLAAAEVLAPLDQRFDAIKDEFFPGPVQTGAYLGTQYAVPWYTNNVALYWNKKMFSGAGLSSPPATWEELVSFGKQLTSDDNFGLMLGADGYGSFLWWPFLWQNGGETISEDGKTALFGNDAGQEAWQFFSDLYLTDKIVPPEILGVTGEWDQYFAPFIQERVAMMMTGDWGILPVQEGNPDLDFDIAPLPKHKEAATVIGGYDLGIPSTSEKQDAAWNFIEWMTAKEQKWILEGYERIPARRDVVESDYATKNPLINVFIEQSEVGRARATVPAWDDIEFGIMSDAWDAVIQRTKSPTDALLDAQGQANEML